MPKLITIPESDFNELAVNANKYEQLIWGSDTNEKVLVVYNPRSAYEPEWSTIRVSGEGEVFNALKALIDEIKQNAEVERRLRIQCQNELIHMQRKLEKTETYKIEVDISDVAKSLKQVRLEPEPLKLNFWDRLKKLHR